MTLLKTASIPAAGRIVSFEDYQVKDFHTGDPKTVRSGEPVLGVRIELETLDSSRAVLYAEKPRMLRAIASAVRSAGVRGADDRL
jgi:hypothetical protein